MLPVSASQVISDTVNSVIAVQNSSSMELFIQVEGFALGNEGGRLLAMQRATNVRTQIEAALQAQNISLTVLVSGTSQTTVLNRFRTDLASVVPGFSAVDLRSKTARAGLSIPPNALGWSIKRVP